MTNWLPASSHITPPSRVFYRPAPPRIGKRGAPCKDEERLKRNEPSIDGPADQVWEGQDEGGQCLLVEAWGCLHLEQAGNIELTLIRVRRFEANEGSRDPHVSWFVWVRQTLLVLTRVWSTYKRCY